MIDIAAAAVAMANESADKTGSPMSRWPMSGSRARTTAHRATIAATTAPRDRHRGRRGTKAR